MKRSCTDHTIVKFNDVPIEVIIKIVYDDIDSLLAIFRINRRLWTTQGMKGFWSGLFKIAYRQQSILLYAFLTESPELTSLWPEAITDLMLMNAAFDTSNSQKKFREYQAKQVYPSHTETLEKLLQGDIDAIDPYYIINIKSDGSPYEEGCGLYSLTTKSRDAWDFVARRHLIKMYSLLYESQIESCPSNILSINDTVEQATIKTYRKGVMPPSKERDILSGSFVIHAIFDHWIDRLSNGDTMHLKSRMVAQRDEFDMDMIAIYTPDACTGRILNPWHLYSHKIEWVFQAHFDLSDEEAILHWKRLFIKTRRSYSPGILPDDASLILGGRVETRLER